LGSDKRRVEKGSDTRGSIYPKADKRRKRVGHLEGERDRGTPIEDTDFTREGSAKNFGATNLEGRVEVQNMTESPEGRKNRQV